MMEQHATGNNEQPQASRDRVRRFRQRVKQEGCVRLEVTIGADVAAKLRAVAKQLDVPLWKSAEDAFEDFARKHGIGEGGE